MQLVTWQILQNSGIKTNLSNNSCPTCWQLGRNSLQKFEQCNYQMSFVFSRAAFSNANRKYSRLSEWGKNKAKLDNLKTNLNSKLDLNRKTELFFVTTQTKWQFFFRLIVAKKKEKDKEICQHHSDIYLFSCLVCKVFCN